MEMHPVTFFHPNRLSRKMLRVVLALYLGVTFVVTVFSFAAEYARTRSAILDELHQLEKTFHLPISTSLWQLNDQQLDSLLHGLLDMPIVEQVDVYNPDGNLVSSLQAFDENSAPLSLFSYERPLAWELSGKEIELGRVRIYSSSDIVLDRVLFGFSMIAATSVFKVSVLSVLFLWAFRNFLGRPLQKLTRQVEEIELEKIGNQKVSLDVKDHNEIYILQEKVNTMLSVMEQDRQKLMRAEENRRKWLEQEVEERTKELVKLNEKLAELASIDDLTGIQNRRSFFEQGNVLLGLSLRQNTPLSLLVLDIDYFKRINDTYGHGVGDAALVHFTNLIQGQLRQTDQFGRVGGEEFAILLSDTDVAGARHLGQKICDLVAQTALDIEDVSLNLSVSIGVVERDSEKSIDKLFDRGDALLYQAKNNGRNRIEG